MVLIAFSSFTPVRVSLPIENELEAGSGDGGGVF